jgi:DNA helicase HerA-like ATPase
VSFLLPKAVFEQHIIILGKTRSGKSSAMRLMVEHLLDKSQPVCIVDPKGDWNGLRVSQDGKHAGYPVVIFGGEHGDVPINARSGGPVAELVATGNRSAIVDLGGWMPGDRTQFFIDFASTYFRTHKGRHHLVIDEVHNFCFKGKVMSPDAGKMLHWGQRRAR